MFVMELGCISDHIMCVGTINATAYVLILERLYLVKVFSFCLFSGTMPDLILHDLCVCLTGLSAVQIFFSFDFAFSLRGCHSRSSVSISACHLCVDLNPLEPLS